jgi:hypothetical protein
LAKKVKKKVKECLPSAAAAMKPNRMKTGRLR